MGLRRADKAGSWYQANPKALAAEIEECLENSRRQFGVPVPKDGKKPVAAVVPHAGLFFSGPVAASAFLLIKEACCEVNTFVVFGACHRALLREPAIWAEGAWETPLGAIEIDAELARAFIAAGVGRVDEAPHHGDNAIELLTPFIKYLFPQAKMVPIAVSPRPDSWSRGEAAARAAAGVGRAIVALASTDLTHYGSSFGVMPAGVGEPALAWLQDNDMRFLDALTKMELERIITVAERDGSACGGGAAAAAAAWARESGCTGGRVLAYTNSYEVMPQGVAEHMVGYGAVAFEV